MRLLRKLLKALRHPRATRRLALHHLLVSPAVALLERIGGVPLLAWLTCATFEVEAGAGDRTRVLVLNRLFFSKDVDQLRARSRSLGFLSLDTHILSVVQMLWLPRELCEQIAYAARTRPEHAAAWARAQDYARRVLAHSIRRWDAGAVLASNVDYWQHESFRAACAQSGVPFLVLCQEEQTVPSVYDASVRMYTEPGFRFTGTAVAVFGKGTGNMLVESGCCSREQVFMTGAPRLDPWFDGSIRARDARLVTFLTFDGDQYFAPRCYLEALKVYAEASCRHAASGLTFVLKCKDAEDEARARGHLQAVDHRIELTNATALTELFPASRLVIGYNSLAVIEALLSPAEIVIPQWADAARDPSEQNVDPTSPECQAHYRFASDPQHLSRLIDDAVSTARPATDAQRRRQLVRKWFHVPAGGSASAATEDFVLRHVSTPRAADPSPAPSPERAA